jgi:predicted TIM-barrel fold metal-dependent hydrolase
VENRTTVNEKIERCLKMVGEIRSDWVTYDIHIHPTEIVFNLCDYTENNEVKGLFSSGRSRYSPPSLEKIEEEWQNVAKGELHVERPQIARMFLQKRYSHTGPTVLCDSFDISEIDRGMLLSVAPREQSFHKQIDLTYRMFKNQERFRLAGSVPNDVQSDHVESFLRRTMAEKGISAVKIHPNISGMNLTTREGKERIGWITEACSILGLPLIIHTGRSNYVDAQWSCLAELRNLEDINLNYKIPIVLAHGGAYGCLRHEMEKEIMPILKRILRKYPNTFVDVSALSYEKMQVLLSEVSTERIMFGSDALYENQCVMLARLVCALEEVSENAEDDLVRVLCHNPGTYIFKENPSKDKKVT